MSNDNTYKLEIETIKSSLIRDLAHFKEQSEILEETIQLGEALCNEEEFTYVRSLKETYFEKQKEFLGLTLGVIDEINDYEKELKKQQWKVVLGGKKQSY